MIEPEYATTFTFGMGAEEATVFILFDPSVMRAKSACSLPGLTVAWK